MTKTLAEILALDVIAPIVKSMARTHDSVTIVYRRPMVTLHLEYPSDDEVRPDVVVEKR